MNNSAIQDETAHQNGKTGHVPFLGEVQQIALSKIKPSPENDTLYKPVDPASSATRELADSIRKHGVREPLVLTLDFYILSGHRRRIAAKVAGLSTVPVRFENMRHDTDGERFVALLVEYNRQRVKSHSEQLREAVVAADPEDAYNALLSHREERAQLTVETVVIEGRKTRSRITDAKEPMLLSIERVLRERRKFWPLSDRSIHYALLNFPPLIHARKANSIYGNDLASYKALVDILTRARLVGRISMNAIADPTRPIMVWDVHSAPGSFFSRELDGFLKGYRRDLQQSQPNHIEIIGEKNTIESTLRPVAGRYNIPLTIGRGFSSLEPRYKLAQRFKKSGKHSLILLTLSDFDPSGQEIAQSFARSLRDDFNIVNVILIPVALNAAHVAQYNLPPQMQAKQSDSRTRKFTAKHGEDVYELEALPPETLQRELTQVIDGVLDLPAFNRELEAEKQDAAYLETIRRRAHLALQDSSE